MNFSLEDKVSYIELAPSLQRLIDSKADQTDLDIVLRLVGGVRLTISSTPPKNPVNDKEIWINSSNNLIMRYQNKWIENDANMAKNIPTHDVGGNIWISDN